MNEPKTVTYKIEGDHVKFPIDISKKGLKRFTIYMDELEMDGTGTRIKDGIPTIYMIFKFIK
jgi:hypothetical protein